jgi:hypothetical protein
LSNLADRRLSRAAYPRSCPALIGGDWFYDSFP